MKIFRSIAILACMFVGFSMHSHEDDSMTCMEKVPEQGVIASITQCAREHIWCILALTGALGYIYMQSTIRVTKSNMYEAALEEAHEHIDELEAQVIELNNAILKYEQLYTLLNPMIKKMFGGKK